MLTSRSAFVRYDVEGAVLQRDFGGMRLLEYANSDFTEVRFPEQERNLELAKLWVMLPTTGIERVAQHGHSAAIGPGEMMLGDVATASEFQADAGTRKRMLVFTRARVQHLWPSHGALVDRVLSPQPASMPLRDLLASVATAAPSELDGTRGDCVGNALLELLFGAFGTAADDFGTDTARWGAALDYIEDNIADPELDAAAIAGALGISVRSLYLLFQEHRHTVRGYIRDRRLQRCYSDLRRSDGSTIAHIAHRWGFADHQTFSRSFRVRFGHAPRDTPRRCNASVDVVAPATR